MSVKDLSPNYKIPKQTKSKNSNDVKMNYNTPVNCWDPVGGPNKPQGLAGPWTDTYPRQDPAANPAVMVEPQMYPVANNLKRKIDKETPKNIKTPSHNRESFSEMKDPSLPKELTSLFQPLYCKLCLAHLNSNSNARLHYKSKNHEKKIKKFLIDHSEKTGEPLHKRVLLTSANNKDDNPRFSYCETCDLQLTSKMHAEQHYMGRNHQKAIIQAKSPAGSGFYGEDGKWHRTLKVLGDTSERSGIGLSFAKPEEFIPKYDPNKHKFFCDLCKVHTTSVEHLQMHYSGHKHQKNAKKLGQDITGVQVGGDLEIIIEPTSHDNIPNSVTLKESVNKDYSVFRTPSGGYYCQPCNLTINMESQFVQHLESKKHLKKQNTQK